MNQTREFLSATDLQQILGISRTAAYNLMAAKDFPSIRVNQRSLRVRKAAFLAWCEKQEKGVG